MRKRLTFSLFSRPLWVWLTFSLLSVNCQTTRVKPLAYHELANEYAHDGLFREAIATYRRAITQNPHDLKSYKNLGMVFVKVGNYKDAARCLEKALPAFSSQYEANFFLAEANRGLEKFADAIFYYQKSLKIRPEEPQALKALAWSYFRIRYYSEALATAKTLHRLEPDDAQASIILARTLLKLKRSSEALKVLHRARAEANARELAYFYSVEGDLALALGESQKAEKLFKLALKEQPLLAGALLGLGKCYLEKKDVSNAITVMEKAARIRPLLTEAHLLLAKSYEKIDQRKALAHYQKFWQQAASDPEYLSLIGDVQQKIAQLKAAPGQEPARAAGQEAL